MGNKYEIHFRSNNSQTFHLSQIQQKPKSRTKQKPKQMKRSSISERATTATWARIYQSKSLDVSSSLQKPTTPLLYSTTHPSQPTAEGIYCDERKCRMSVEGRGGGSRIRPGHLGGHYLQCSALCWHAFSLASADILRVHALRVCLNKKADKECLSVSSI